MKASELINILQSKLDTHGDLEVKIYFESIDIEIAVIEKVNYSEDESEEVLIITSEHQYYGGSI